MGCSASVEVERSEKQGNVEMTRGGSKPLLASHKFNETKKILNSIDLEKIKASSEEQGAVKPEETSVYENSNSCQSSITNITKNFEIQKNKEVKVKTEEQSEDFNEPLTEEQLKVENALVELRKSLFGGTGPTENNNINSFTVDNARQSENNKSLRGDRQHVAIIETGSGFCKAGFAGNDMPSVVMPTVVGRQKEATSPPTSVEKTFIGKDAKLRGDSLIYTHPIQRGVVTDWDDVEKVYQHILELELNIDPKEYSLIIPLSPTSDETAREKLAKIMFEKLDVKELLFESSSVFAMHAMGVSTGLVVSVGHGSCHAVPVDKGKPLNYALRSTEIGHEDVIRRMIDLMKSNHQINIDENIAKAMVEKTCYTCLDYEQILDDEKLQTITTYTLPNETVVKLQKERFMCSEVLFKPSLIGLKMDSLVEICLSSINAIKDKHLELNMRLNIVLIGGPSNMPGLDERLKIELTKSDDASGPTYVPALPKRQYASWRGAAKFSTMNSSELCWIDKSQYKEKKERWQ